MSYSLCNTIKGFIYFMNKTSWFYWTYLVTCFHVHFLCIFANSCTCCVLLTAALIVCHWNHNKGQVNLVFLKAHTMPSEAHLKNVYKESGTKTWSGSRLKIQNHRYTVGVLISCGTFEVFVGILGLHCVPICHVPVLINIIWTWNSFSSIFLLQAFSKIPEPIFSSMALTLRLFFSSKLIERTHFRAFIYPIPPTNSESFLQTEAKQLNLSAGVNEMLRVEWIWSHEKCL